MANITEKLNVGDEVYVNTKYNYLLAKVVKKTPAGKVDVAWGDSNKRFRADGTLDSADRFDRDRYHLDHLTVPERQAEMAKEQRARVAVDKIRAIEPEQRLRAEWGQESLQKEVDRLQGLLDEAKMAVRAISHPSHAELYGEPSLEEKLQEEGFVLDSSSDAAQIWANAKRNASIWVIISHEEGTFSITDGKVTDGGASLAELVERLDAFTKEVA